LPHPALDGFIGWKMSAHINFNTLAAFEAIQSTGLTEAQAKRIVQTIIDSQAELATKQDLDSATSLLKREIAETKTELMREIAETKTELKQDINNINWQIKGIIAMQALTLTGLGFLFAHLVGAK
jgi:hypothetical protein